MIYKNWGKETVTVKKNNWGVGNGHTTSVLYFGANVVRALHIVRARADVVITQHLALFF